MINITVIIPTLNEESNIQRALDSVFFVNEIIVIDAFSTDKTLEIAKKGNVRIIQRKFDDFSSQKNYAMKYATNDWVLFLDADEQITKELRKSIQKLDLQKTKTRGFKIHRSNFVKDKKLKFGGFKDTIIRLFHKEYAAYTGLVHEKAVINGKVEVLKGTINHYTYKNFSQFKKKVNYYAELRAIELADKISTVSFYQKYLKPLARFCIHYIVKFGFLDGIRGALFSYLMAYGVYKRYERLEVLKRSYR